ncbi:MAG: ABC transporter substrate-binding protein [Acetobacter sp.]|nr:ABC transporter substrate-binding protein [Acetobacter sp.]
MFKSFQIALIGLFMFMQSVLADTVAVNSTDARMWANSKGQELLQVLSEADPIIKYSKLDKMMTEYVNLDYVSKFVIGKYARIMTNEQKERYQHLFQRYILSVYKQFNLNINASDIKFSIDTVTEHPRFTTVQCTIDASNILKNIQIEKIPVKFKLIRGTGNAIQAVDVEISEVSMVIEYRKRFYQMIKEEEEDINWFLDRFDDKVRANEKAFQQRAEI